MSNYATIKRDLEAIEMKIEEFESYIKEIEEISLIPVAIIHELKNKLNELKDLII